MNVRPSTSDATLFSVASSTAPTEPAFGLWTLALATYGVGDGVTTAALVWISPVHGEANPLVGAAIDAFGATGLVGLKIVGIGTCFALSLWGSTDDDQFMFYLPPVTLVLVGTATTLFNASLLW
jgi:hypothetical protein